MKVLNFTRKREKTGWLLIGLIAVLLLLPQMSYTATAGQEMISLEEAFHRIGEKYDVFFNYDRVIAADIKVEYEENQHHSLNDDMDYVLKNTNLGYQIFDQRFVVVFQNNDQGIKSLKEMIGHVQGFVNERETVKKQEVRPVRRLSTLSPTDLYKKRLVFNVSGTVTDDAGNPLIGVNILVKGTSKGTATDFEGIFFLEDIDDNAILVVSYVGYQTQEVPVAGKSNLTITLVSDSQFLDEVVVVGYGTQKKVNLTGSVSSIDVEKELEGRAVTDATQILAGLMPGVQVKQSTGQPGNDETAIRIRGVGTLNDASPLVIIDGVESNLSDVNPSDIKEISVLKDAASASIYGSRAANGVILVTTKTGKAGAPVIQYDGYASRQTPMKLIDMVSNFTEHMRLTNEAQVNSGLPAPFDFNNSIISSWEEKSKTDWRYANTDWYDEILNPDWSFNHNLSISGGTPNTTYRATVGYLSNQGIVENAGFEKYSGRINIQTHATDWLTLGMNTFGIWSNQELTDVNWVFNVLPAMSPGMVPRSADGRYGGASAEGERFSDINVLATSNWWNGNNERTKIFSKFYSKIDLSSNLKFESSFTIDFANRNLMESDIPIDLWNFIDNRVSRTLNAPPLGAENLHEREYQYVIDNLLHYSNSFSEVHNLEILAGYNENYSRENWFEAEIDGIIDVSTPVLAAGVDNPQVDGNAADRSLRSIFGRVNYNYKEKYLLEGNLRHDGSSKFSKDRRWGTFPSFSVGWRLSNENFMSGLNSIENLTLRASWGKLGNNRIGDYEYQSVYESTNYLFGGSIAPGAAQGSIANSIISWETTNMLNFGFLLHAFENRLTFEFDWFNRETRDILVRLPIPGVLGGLSAPRQNVGVVQNRGVDIQLGWVQSVNGDFSYGINGNMGYVRDEVLKFNGENPALSDQNILLEGHPIWTYYVREVDRMIRTNEDVKWVEQQLSEGKSFRPAIPELGDLVYKDADGDGVYGDNDDRVITGKSINPNLTFGVSGYLNWKGFDVSMLFNGATGVYGYHRDVTNRVDRGSGWAYSKEIAYDHWTPETPNATYPRFLAQRDSRNVQTSDFWLRNASYVKLKNFQIGYSLPEILINKVGVQNRVRIYASGENLFTISSDWSGLDPETVRVGQSQRIYPTMRQFVFGLNVTF